MGTGVGEVELDLSADLVLDDDLLPGRAEADGAGVLVEISALFQSGEILLVNGAAFALVVGTMVAPFLRALVPVEAKPVETVEDDLLGLLGVAGVVRVLDAENEGPGVLAGIDPVEEGGTGASHVEKAGRGGCEACAYGHPRIRIHLRVQLKRVGSKFARNP